MAHVPVRHKNFIGMKSTPHLITRDHDPRRADQCNLHTHVIANNNKSPIEKQFILCLGKKAQPRLAGTLRPGYLLT